MKTTSVFILSNSKEMFVESLTFQELTPEATLAAPQGPGTNALVHNPFAFEDLSDDAALPALQGPGTNALVHNPFTWSS